MSTILKALRRLEEDRSPRSSSAENTTDSVRATDPGATDELRDRILTEEAVAQAVAAGAQRESDRKRRLIMRSGAAVVLALGLGVGIYMIMSAGIDSEPIPNVIAIAPEPASEPTVKSLRAGDRFAGIAPRRATSARADDSPMPAAPTLPVPMLIPVAEDSIAASSLPSAVSRSTPKESSAPPTGAGSAVQQASAPPSASGEMVAAAVTPTPASLAANAPRTVAGGDIMLAEEPVESTPPRRRPAPTTIAKAPPEVSARQSASSTSPKSVVKSTPAVAKPSRPARESRPDPESSSIARPDRPDLPELTIMRTAWHPSADRRTAKIRLEDTNEIMNLREGDAIGGLVIMKISPSAVLFKAGDVEVRHRVGHPGSGG